MTDKDDGGPIHPTMTSVGITLRDYAAIHAPASEIADMLPATAVDCAEFLGLDVPYVFMDHYPLLIRKARYQWADAMLAARGK